jgi:amino acid transporter
MEGTAIPADDAAVQRRGGAAPPTGAAPGQKGLKQDAIGFVSSVVIGVASVAPGYSMAATLGLLAAVVGVHSPGIMLAAFVPMLFIAFAYRYLNKAEPDSGTTFAWVTRAMSPTLGWINGWVIIVADVIVMANLAQIAGSYTFLLVGAKSAAASKVAVTAVGVLWIAIMTAIVYIGIELSARTQRWLLSAEIFTLTLFSVVALVKVYSDNPAGSIHPDISWFDPFGGGSFTSFVSGILLAIFIYWGWDSGVAVNEETQDPKEAPGKAAIISTVILLVIYVLLATAGQAYHGTKFLADNSSDVFSALGTDVFGSPLDKLLIIAVLTSAAASTQTTILPTARTTLSMARWGALPRRIGHVHPRFMTPTVSTLAMGIASIVWYVGLTAISENILFDSIAAIGLMIAFYYGFTGIACAIYFRRAIFKGLREFVIVGFLPFAGGLTLLALMVKNGYDLSKPENGPNGDKLFGLGTPLVISVVFVLLGILLMLWWRFSGSDEARTFFSRKPEPAVIDPITGEPAVPAGAATG